MNAPGSPPTRAALERILDVSRQLATSPDLERVLGRIIDALRDLLQADRASVFQYEASTDTLFATQAHGLPTDLRLPASAGLVGESARSRQVINIPDAYADERFNKSVDDQTGYRTRCMLTIPLVDFEDELVGVAQVLNKTGGDGATFDESDEAVAEILARHAAEALKRASLLRARAQKEKLEADLRVARQIQQAALPSRTPDIPGYDIACSFEPCDETGGDGYDLLRRAGADASSGFVVFMGDATGHGVGPALSMATAVSMVRMAMRMGVSINDAMGKLNIQLCDDLPLGRFITAFLGELDSGSHELRYVSAGQAPLIAVHPDGSVERRDATLLPLGLDGEASTAGAEPFRFQPGSVFLLLSDGFYEASNPDLELIGPDPIARAVLDVLDEPASGIIEAITGAVDEFSQGEPQADDRTAIVLKRNPA